MGPLGRLIGSLYIYLFLLCPPRNSSEQERKKRKSAHRKEKSAKEKARAIPLRAKDSKILLVRRFPKNPNRKQRVPFVVSRRRLERALDQLTNLLLRSLFAFHLLLLLSKAPKVSAKPPRSLPRAAQSIPKASQKPPKAC